MSGNEFFAGLFLESVGPQANDRNDPETHDHKRHRHHEQDADRVRQSRSVGVQSVFTRRTGRRDAGLQECQLHQNAKRDGEKSSWTEFLHKRIVAQRDLNVSDIGHVKG